MNNVKPDENLKKKSFLKIMKCQKVKDFLAFKEFYGQPIILVFERFQ